MGGGGGGTLLDLGNVDYQLTEGCYQNLFFTASPVYQ